VKKNALVLPALLLPSLWAANAGATLLLDTTVTAAFGGATTASTTNNDLSSAPSEVYLGQLRASAAGYVDFLYIGNEAGYWNTLMLDGSAAHSVGPDTFSGPYSVVGSLSVGAGDLLDFGFCTSGGQSIAGSRCAYNDDAGSLSAQYNYPVLGAGYRSIGFAALTGFDSSVDDSWSFATPMNGASDLWMILWDDSGASNDDDYDDYVAVARFRPVSVPEPATLSLLGAGLLMFGFLGRRRRRVS
jgi:hypothetical protein